LKIDIIDARPKRKCGVCGKVGEIVGLDPYDTNLTVHRVCNTEDCENNFRNNNGKEWGGAFPYEVYTSNELREILKWIENTGDKIVPRFEGSEIVVGWNGRERHRFQRIDLKNDNNPLDFMTKAEFTSRKIKEVLEAADGRERQLSDASAKWNTEGRYVRH
jgi:hypothetical protein